MPKNESIVKQILEENGLSSGIDTSGTWIGTYSRGYASEKRIDGEMIGEIYALAVYEYGSIDTNHTLYLINLRDRVIAHIADKFVCSPDNFFGRITIVALEEADGIATIKYKIGEEKFVKRYRLSSHTETGVKTVPKLEEVS